MQSQQHWEEERKDCNVSARTSIIPFFFYPEMDLRLNSTGCRCSGWLEVLHAATWKRIDSRNFTQHNAELACEQLGCHFPFGILQPYVEELEKHETCLMNCQGNETVLKDCIACDSHNFTSLAVFLVCQGMYNQPPSYLHAVFEQSLGHMATASGKLMLWFS